MAKFAKYRQLSFPLPAVQWRWQLTGAGLVNLGADGQIAAHPLPDCGPDELLVRNDAVSLCFSDVKIILMGQQHPRLTERDLAAQPLVPGHEVSLTVLAVGEKRQDTYQVGQRFVVQPDVWYQGRSTPYGYALDGAYQQYGIIGPAILDGDAGSYLIPVPDEMPYAGAALTEPWACVEASYRIIYRTTLKDKGQVWFVGHPGSRSGYRLDKIWDSGCQPKRVVMTDVPDDLAAQLRDRCQMADIECVTCDLSDIQWQFDDIFILDGEADTIDQAACYLAKGGILAIARPTPLSRPIQMDLGRLHYDHIVYVGTTTTDLDAAYQQHPVQASLEPDGTAWIIGAGGPMGRMHIQRAIESPQSPRHILATEVSSVRAKDLTDTFSTVIQQHGLTLIVLDGDFQSPAYQETMNAVVRQGGITDVQVMAPVPSLVTESTAYLAVGGVVNLFAGLKRGTTAPIDAWLIYGPQQIRLIGHSGSALADQVEVVKRAVNGQLTPERSLVALAGLNQLPLALQAMIDAVYPGKIVIYPAILDFPLTTLPDLESVLPQVHAKLLNGRIWTPAAEALFLETLLPD